MRRPRVLYLDQNKWIELAQCVADPQAHSENYVILEFLVEEVREKRLVVPLTFTNIYETHKIKNSARRSHLGWVQATLSQGYVFRSRSALVQAQIADYLSAAFSVAPTLRPADWFLSNLFWEAVAEHDPAIFGYDMSKEFLANVQSNAQLALFSFLTDGPEKIRLESVRQFSNSSRDLIARIEQRRELLQDQPIAVRRRAYSAELLLAHVEVVLKLAADMGLPIKTVRDLGSSRARAIVSQVPALDIERELVTKIENEARRRHFNFVLTGKSILTNNLNFLLF